MKVLAIDVGGTAIKSAIVHADGTIEDFRELATPSVIAEGILEAAKGYSDYAAVGICTAGLVDYKKGIVIFSSAALGYHDNEPLAEEIGSVVGVPVVVENDVNAAAMGEAMFGAGRGCDDFVCLTYGTSIGGALYLNGGLYRGSRNMAGEIGHVATHAFGKPCPCGKRGCYSEYASVTALVNEAKKLNPAYDSGRVIAAHMNSDPSLMEIVRAWAHEVCVGLMGVVHTFDPPRVILGGGLMSDDSIIQMIRQALPDHILDSYGSVEIVGAETGNRAGLLGAAALAMEAVAQA